MTNHEIGTHFEASPEPFVPAREVMWSFLPDNKPDKEPDYDEMIERGRRRLLEAIENDSEEQIVFSEEELAESKGKKQKPNPWEPFNLEPHPSQNFVNLYGGPYSQQMELNRANAERLLEVAGIEGKVILADRPMDRSRSVAGVNPDGSVTGRRKLFWGEKIEEEDKSQSLVKSIPEGWRIEIPGQEILDELSRQENKKPLDQRFASGFNQIIRDSLMKIMFREKLTPDGGNSYKIRAACTIASLSLVIPLGIAYKFGNLTPAFIALDVGSIFYMNFLANLGIGRLWGLWSKRSTEEGILFPIELDRYLRGIAFMKNKGRNLIRLAAG